MTAFTFPVTSMVLSPLQAAVRWSACIGGIQPHSPFTDGPASMSPAVPAVHAYGDAMGLSYPGKAERAGSGRAGAAGIPEPGPGADR